VRLKPPTVFANRNLLTALPKALTDGVARVARGSIVDRGATVLVDDLSHVRDDVHRATLGTEAVCVVTLVRADRRRTRSAGIP
jgi:hypothetical protein